jgi:SAM-dependent methyltransferase
MNQFLRGVARAVLETFSMPGPVLEIGSYQVSGQEDLINLRSYFTNRHYLGLDIRPGPGVDMIGSVENLPFATGTVGTVVAMSTFEHVQHFWRGFDEVYRVLKPRGVFFVTCPFHFHIHNYPNDYWRFTPDAFKLLLDRYPMKLLGTQGPTDRPHNVWALAFREKAVTPTAEQLKLYEEKLNRYAHEPMGMIRKMRYRLGRILCGSRPFAPWLLRDQWQVEVVSNKAA